MRAEQSGIGSGCGDACVYVGVYVCGVIILFTLAQCVTHSDFGHVQNIKVVSTQRENAPVSESVSG